MENTMSDSTDFGDFDALSKKKLHEKFVSGHNGTTPRELLIFSGSAPLFVFISVFLVNCITYNVNLGSKRGFRHLLCVFMLEFTVIVIPIVFLCTMLSEHMFLPIFITFFVCILIISYYMSTPSAHSLYWIKYDFKEIQSVPVKEYRRSFITCFRSLINLMTAICILAVDFHIFPRRFAKTESYGFGLMDVGVGVFIMANAVVENKEREQSLYKYIKGCLLLFLLGILRYFCLQNIDYQMHISEYGVHCNFFIILALTKIFSTAILRTNVKPAILSVVFILFHEISLLCGLEKWVVSETARDNFIDANKESISSLTGYIGLYFTGVTVGQFVHIKKQTIGNDIKLCVKLCAFSLLLLFFTSVLHHTLPVSRRLVNITYIVWIVSVTLFTLFLSSLAEILQRCFFDKILYQTDDCFAPKLLQAINYNGLAFFAAANLLTGLINILILTLDIGPWNSVLIIIAYMFVLCAFVMILSANHIRIKI